MEQVASGMTAHLASQPMAGPIAGHARVALAPEQVALLTGGFDRPYAFGLSMALSSRGVGLDVIGSDEVDSPEMHSTPGLNFLNLEGSRKPGNSPARRTLRLLTFYARLCRYAASAEPRIFHILWNNKLSYIDRTLLMVYFRMLGKKVVLTAHNINAAKRDANDSLLNRLTLEAQYRLAEHVFVHTEKMKEELLQDFGVAEHAASVIPFGINNSVPDTDITPAEAKRRLGLGDGEKAILFFGSIRPYKGLEYLVAAFGELSSRHPDYRLIIAGERKKGSEGYLDDILESTRHERWQDKVIQKIEFIPDEETEVYFKAADVLVLPYTQVFQSGVLFLAYSFGLPVIATDVGSLSDDVVKGETGFVCRPADPQAMAAAIEAYFVSDLYKTLEQRRPEIRKAANAQNSWEIVADRTCSVYAQLLAPLRA
jgi:glycosyltransferase involved in cell wall biosynthesis